MKRVTKAILGIGAVGGTVLAGLFGYALYTGPRMKVQPHVRAYQRVMPMPPTGSVIVGKTPFVPAQATVSQERGVQPGGAGWGAIYYSYYCLACHGEDGRGHGPVGQSYYPAPPDLTRRAVTPASLHVAMLTGPGHSPVLERVVRPAYRWDLVAYLQTLKR